MNTNYIQMFINACYLNNVEEAKMALECGLNIQKDFNFENPDIFFNILNTRSEKIIVLVLEFGFDSKQLLEKSKTYNSLNLSLTQNILAPFIFKEELDNKLPMKSVSKNKKLKI